MERQADLSGMVSQVYAERAVTFYIRSRFILVKGSWDWPLETDAVFCSDVILSHPIRFEGLKSIIHPEDAELIRKQLSEGVEELSFRIITTFGEVKQLAGRGLVVEEINDDPDSILAFGWNQASREIQLKAELEKLQLLRDVYERSEKFTLTGTWWYNPVTNEAWYSAQVFRIHDLPPNSLNAHLETFTGFINPEDREIAKEFIDKALIEQLPLHIEFRIRTSLKEKWIRYTSQWHYNLSGASVLSGTYQDITELKNEELHFLESERDRQFQRQLLQYGEQSTSAASWQVDLLTRKTFYSDHYYRIFGMKPQAVAPGISGFINHIHPDDRARYEESYRRMMEEHIPPEIEFRILRADGKVRFIIQKAKKVLQQDDHVMMGTIQDISVSRFLEKKLKELTGQYWVKDMVRHQAEEMSSIGSWVWETGSGQVAWSDNMFRILGFRPSSDITHKWLMQMTHPEDQKKFSEELKIARTGKEKRSFEFRLVHKGQVKYFKTVFSMHLHEQSEYLVGTFQDVTGEHALRAELYERVQLAEALSENILDRVIITDINNNVIVWNTPCELWYAIPKSDAIGKNFFDLFPKLKNTGEIELFNRVLKGQKVSRSANRSGDGHGFYDLHMLPLWNEQKDSVNGIVHIIHDVTRETELRQNLNDRLSFIENLVESSVDRIIAMDRNLNYLVWNKKCEEFYGLRKEQVIGKNLLEIFPDAQNTPTYEQFRRVLKGETIQIHPSPGPGQTHYHEVYLIPVKNDHQEIIAILWILHDLTRQYKIENDLRLLLASLELQNKIYEHAEDIANMGTWTWNPATNDSMYSDKMFELFGMQPGEVKPGFDTIPRFIHPDDRNKMLQRAGELKEGQQPVGIEYRVIRKDGVERIFRNRVKLVKNETGETICVGTTEDITEKKKAEQELFESRELLQQTTMATPDAITVYDLVNKKPVYLNNCLSEWTGYSATELVDMGYEGRLSLIYTVDRDKLVDFNKKMMEARDGAIHTIEYRIVSKKGLIWIRNRSKVFRRNEAGEVTHLLSVLQDFTEEVVLREKLSSALS